MKKRTSIPITLWTKANDKEKDCINELIADQNTLVFVMEKLALFGASRGVIEAWRATERD